MFFEDQVTEVCILEISRMVASRFEIGKFHGKSDFELWKAKIKAVLGQQKALLWPLQIQQSYQQL